MTDFMTEEEMELLSSFEEGEWISSEHFAQRKQQLQAYAKNTLDQIPVRIFIQRQDLKAIQNQALEEGIEYKTLIYKILQLDFPFEAKVFS